MTNEDKISIFSMKAQIRIYNALKLNNINLDWIGEIKALGDIIVSSPSYENIHINRNINLEKVCMSDELYKNAYDLDQYVNFTIRLATLVINEEIRIECPKKFAGQVIFLENSANDRNFCYIYGFGN